MKLSEILKGIQNIEVKGDIEVEVNGIAYDSRKVEEGFLFDAIVGFVTDGHKYIESAIQNGAKVIAMQKGCYDVGMIPDSITVVFSEDTRKLLPQISCNFYRHPSRDLKVVGVTGTKGKTTTTYMIKSILENAGKKVGLIGTIANYDGEKWIDAERTSPESTDIQRLLRQMADNGVNVAVMEVSSHSLSLDRVWRN